MREYKFVERLTKHTPVEFGYAEYVWNGDVDEQDAIGRLGAYEDTGLTPSEILKMRDLCESLKGMYELNAFRDEHLYRCPAKDFCHSGECEQAWLDWLKQPLKEESQCPNT